MASFVEREDALKRSERIALQSVGFGVAVTGAIVYFFHVQALTLLIIIIVVIVAAGAYREGLRIEADEMIVNSKLDRK